MLSHQQIKHINALKIKKYRDEYKEFIAEGNTLVCDLISSPYVVAGVYALSTWITEHLEIIMKNKIPVFEADFLDMERVTSLSSASPVLAVIKIPLRADEILAEANETSIRKLVPGLFQDLSLMLDGISDPGNLGTMLRIADWFGIRNVFCSETCVELYNPKVVQSSMGSVARVRVFYSDLVRLLAKLRGSVPVYGAFMEGEPLFTSKLELFGIVIIGSEAHGISTQLLPYITNRLYIPSFGASEHGKAESLNAAVAAGIVISEFRRRSGSGL